MDHVPGTSRTLCCPGPLPALLPSALTLGQGDGRQEQQPQEQQPRAGPRAGGAGSDCRVHRAQECQPEPRASARAAGLELRRLVVPHPLKTRFIPAICLTSSPPYPLFRTPREASQDLSLTLWLILPPPSIRVAPLCVQFSLWTEAQTVNLINSFSAYLIQLGAQLSQVP